MIKPDDRAALEALAKAGPYQGGVAMRALCRAGTHPKRQHRLAEKWDDRGWWDCGMTLRSGWLTPEGHRALLAFLDRNPTGRPASPADTSGSGGQRDA